MQNIRILALRSWGHKKRHEQVFYRTPWAIGSYLRAPFGGRPQRISSRCAPTDIQANIRNLGSQWHQVSACPQGPATKRGVRMEVKSSPNPCSAINRRPFSRPAKSKGLLTKSSPTFWSCSKSGHREGRGGWSTECRPSDWASQDISH